MAKTRKHLLAPVAFGLLVGCGTPQGAATAPAAPAAGSNQTSTPAQNVAMVKGYLHRQSVSLFRVGNDVTQVSRQYLTRTIGSEGVFAVHEMNGATIAVPNATARVLTLPPMFDNAAAHNQHTLNYFTQAGIPKDQIAGVSTNYEGIGSGTLDEVAQTKAPQIIGYYSVLSRSIEGIPVTDSYAFARFAQDGQVATEGVYWPDVPRHVVDEAKVMRDALNDPVRGAAMKAKLPAGAPVHVAIRHSGDVDNIATVAHASYDVLMKDNGIYHRHFDASGVELRKPERLNVTEQILAPHASAQQPQPAVPAEPPVFTP